MKNLLCLWLSFQQKQRLLFVSCVLAFSVWAFFIAVKSEIQAFPELTNVQVQVITQYPGKAAEEVERRLTIPLEVATSGISGLIGQRSISLFGLSVITLTFDDSFKLNPARLAVSQRLTSGELPEGVKPTLSPESTPVGEIFRYTVEGSLDLDERKLIQDWTLEREFKSIPGVADVVSFGGPVRTYEVVVDISRLNAFGLTVNSVAQALGQNHANAGGSLITRGEETYVVRSLGLYESAEGLQSAVVGTQKNTPIRVRDIGRVRIGHKMRLGQVGRNENDDTVEGIVLLREGADTLSTCEKIRNKVVELNKRLPAGAQLVKLYDRTDLITRCSYTVLHNVCFGVLLVCLILGLGLGFQYWSLIAAISAIIPFALLTAFVGVKFFGYSPNLISLGAVDFGIIIETAIFAAEAVAIATLRNRKKDAQTISDALSHVLGPAFLCALLLLVAFIPILSLERVEGRIFRPLGITLVSALIGGQLGALIFVPFFSRWVPLVPATGKARERFFSAIFARCEKIGSRLANLKRPGLSAGLFFVVVISALSANLGREFLPNLNEGALYIRVTAPPTISREASVELASLVRSRLRKLPEVIDVISQIGRPDDGTDSNGFDNIEFLVSLVNPNEWKTAHSMDGLTAAAQKLLGDVAGVSLNFSQPIKDNVDEAISGVKGELVVKIFGPSLEELQRDATTLVNTLKTVAGAEDVAAERLFGQPEMRFTMNRELLARYGIRVTDAEDVLESAFNGKLATQMLDEKGRTIDVVVKPQIPESPGPRSLASLPVLSPEGGRIPLGDLSNIHLVEGVNRIYRENNEKRVAVKCSVRGRPVMDFVNDANHKLKSALKLPIGYRLEWSGSFENASRAGKQLFTIIPLCAIVIFIILFAWFGQVRLVGSLFWEVPFSAFGGLMALRIFGLNLSISAACGGVVLFGVSLLTGMMLINGWLHHGSGWLAVKNEGRGILLSSGVAIAGLIPAAFSTGMGSETARPFAVMILGGLLSSVFFTLTVLPVLLDRLVRGKAVEISA